MTTDLEDLRLIKLCEVCRLTALGRSRIYELISEGHFPRPKQLPGRRVAWREAEVRGWLETVEPTSTGSDWYKGK